MKIHRADRISVPYQTQPTCTPFQVRWESQLEVTVLLERDAGSLPSAGVEVTWWLGETKRVRGDIGWGSSGSFKTVNVTYSGLTDENGKIVILLHKTWPNAPREILVSIRKSSAHIEHRFECNGLPCANQRLFLNPLTFDNKMAFTDVSTEPFIGNIFIDGTQHDAMSFGCPLAGVQVCLIDHIHHTSLGCSITDEVGYYVVPVAIGLMVYPIASYANHTFTRIADPSVRSSQGSITTVDNSGGELKYDYFTIDENGDWRVPVHFLDTSSSKVSLAVAGGKCNRTLGNTTVRFSYTTCASTWSKDVTFSEWQTSVAMPAHKFQVEVVEVNHPTIEIGDTVPAYLTAIGTIKQDVDMTQEESQVRWEYRPEPTIHMEIVAAAVAPNCTDLVIARDIETDVIITVLEEYHGQPACTWIEGNVTLHNQLGENAEDAAMLVRAKAITAETGALLSRCAEECTLELEMELGRDGLTYHSAKATVRIMTGEPETAATIAGVKYAKPISISMNTGVYAVSQLTPVIVTGQKLISDKFSMDFPEYFPLLIL